MTAYTQAQIEAGLDEAAGMRAEIRELKARIAALTAAAEVVVKGDGFSPAKRQRAAEVAAELAQGPWKLEVPDQRFVDIVCGETNITTVCGSGTLEQDVANGELIVAAVNSAITAAAEVQLTPGMFSTPEAYSRAVAAAAVGDENAAIKAREHLAALQQVVAIERERCAQVADNEPEAPGDMPAEFHLIPIEDAIRAAIRATKKSIAAAIRRKDEP